MKRHTALILYGAPSSQPSRAVAWTCLLKELPFELREARVDQMGASERIKALNPTGQVPTIEDGDFVLYEMPAILIYLCEQHGWDDLLPKAPETRARVHQYLHFHHNWTRRVTMELMAPHVTVAFREFIEQMGHVQLLARLDDPGKLEAGRRCAARIADLIERGQFANGSSWLCGDRVTLADIACYEELAQLREANLFDFEGFPKIQRWLDGMQTLPFHEAAHRYNVTLGDIRTTPNTIERFLAASAAGVAALEERGVRVRAIE